MPRFSSVRVGRALLALALAFGVERSGFSADELSDAMAGGEPVADGGASEAAGFNQPAAERGTGGGAAEGERGGGGAGVAAGERRAGEGVVSGAESGASKGAEAGGRAGEGVARGGEWRPAREREWDRAARGEAPAGEKFGYDYVLPLFGESAAREGHELPLPIGISVFGNVVDESIDVSDLRVGIGGGPLVDAGWVRIRSVDTTAYTAVARLDAWLLPMVAVYGIAGTTWASTTVKIDEPVIIEPTIESEGPTYGFGGTLALGNRLGFLVVDANWTWTDLDILSTPQRAMIVTPRAGHRFEIDRTSGMALKLWVGACYEHLAGSTAGRLKLSEVAGGSDLRLSPDYLQYIAGLPGDQQENAGTLLGEALAAVLAGDAGRAPADFRLRIRPTEEWNMVAGFQFDVNRHVQFLLETGFLGTRTAGTASFGIRFGF